ncbi:hypothetical protein [Streptomyces griseus]|uniref:hypothetical protein n=1 Tax=Streptomyces griseus TaxID=1911 RepID=UPI0037A5F18C
MTQNLVPPTNARAIDENGAVVRGAEPAPATTVMRGMVFGSGLAHSLDYVVLLHVLFRLEENQPFTPKDIWRGLQAEGIRSAKSHKDLVGRDAVYEAFNRIIAAKFIRRVEDGAAPGRFGKVRYELYRQPAYNPDFAPSPEPWVPGESPALPRPAGPLPGTPEAGKADGETAGRTVSRNAGTGIPVSGVPGNGRVRIPAGQTASAVPGSGNVVPPTPPFREEEDSSSRKSSSTTAVPAGARATDVTAVEAAAEFLAELPGKWACGRKSAARLAPLLAESVAEQGWELGADLRQQLTRRSQGRRAAQALLKDRIEDLPRYQQARRSLEQERTRAARVEEEQLPVPEGEHVPAAGPVLPEGVSAERVEEARELLLRLTGPWALSPESAARLAPLLAAKTAERGWAFDQALLTQLMSNPDGAKNYELVLERNRIGCLPVRRKAPGQRGGGLGRNARQEAIDACTVCDVYGQYELGGATVLCKHNGPPPAAADPSAEAERPEPDAPSGQRLAQRGLGELLASLRQPTV